MKNCSAVFASNNTRPTAQLYNYCVKEAWEDALGRIARHPKDVVWLTCDDDEGCTPLHAACQNWAPLEVIQKMLSAYPDTVRATTSHGKLPLHVACESGASLEVMQILLQTAPETAVFGGSPWRSHDETPLDWLWGYHTNWSSFDPFQAYKEDLLDSIRLYDYIMENESLRKFWCKAVLLLATAHRGRASRALHPNDPMWIVRAAAALRLRPCQSCIKHVDEGTRMILEMYGSTREFRGFSGIRGVVAVLVEVVSHLLKERAAVPNGGFLLHRAIEHGYEWQTLETIMVASPEVLAVADSKTRLHAFMLAASLDADLDTIFQLLCAAPDVIKTANVLQ